MGIIVEPDYNEEDSSGQSDPRHRLAMWVMAQVDPWRIARDSTFRDRWDESYRCWRGRYSSESKTRQSERSKIISPASQIAVDLATAEMVEAIFSRENLFDIADDLRDEDKADAVLVRDQLREDLMKDGIIEFMQEAVLNGALYGNFIGKVVTDVSVVARPVVETVEDEDGVPVQRVTKKITEEVKVYPVAIEPGQLAVDPSACDIDSMLGVAHEFPLPTHIIRTRQADGVYYDDVVVGSDFRSLPTDDRGDEYENRDKGSSAFITEYHGLVPVSMIASVRAQGDELAEAITKGDDEDEMIEAIVTIANDNIILRAIPNPCVMEDRAIVSRQFDTVPNRFWGRGIMEKGYNMQKALDAELRARADALAWINNPMLAGDITKLPPNFNMNSWPGKFWGTKGNPAETLQELRFSDINPSTFTQAGELERMHQQATGAIDPSVLNAGTRDQATGASAINVSGIVKRSKRAMLNLESFFTDIIRKVAWRKMQHNPERYPVDYEFVVRGTVGIMAREVEQAQLVQALQFVEQGSPEYAAVLKQYFEGTTMTDKKTVIAALDASMQPPSEEEQQKAQQLEEMQMAMQMAELQKAQAEAEKLKAEAARANALAQKANIEADMIDDELQLGTVKARVDIQQAQNQAKQVAVTERKQALEEAKFQRGE